MLRSPSLLGDKQFLQVSRSKALSRDGTTVMPLHWSEPIIDAIGEFSSGGSCCGRYSSSIPVPLDTADHFRTALLGPGTNTAWYVACGTPFSSQAESCYQTLGSVLGRRWVLGVCGSTRSSSLRESFVLLSVPLRRSHLAMVPESSGSFGSSSNAQLGMLGSTLVEGISREATPHGLYVCLRFTLTASGLGWHVLRQRD